MSRFCRLPQRLSTSIYRCLLSLSTTAEDSFSEIFLAAPQISRCSLFRQLILKALLNARVIRIAISLWHLSLSACNLLSSASTCKFDFALAIYPLLYFHSWLRFYSRSYLFACNSTSLRLLTLLYCYSTLASSLSTHVIWFCWALLFLNHFSYSYICHSDFSHIGILGLYDIILCNPAVWCLLSHAVSYVVFRIWFHFDVWIFLILFLKQYFAVCFSIVFAAVCFALQNPNCAVAAQLGFPESPYHLTLRHKQQQLNESTWCSHQAIVNFHSDVTEWMNAESRGFRYLFSNQSNAIHLIKFKVNETLLVADNQLDLLNQAKWVISSTWVSGLFRWWLSVLARVDS